MSGRCQTALDLTPSKFVSAQAYLVRTQTIARPLCGGILLPFAIGAVVLGASAELHTPLSGQISPVFARVPIGTFIAILLVFLH